MAPRGAERPSARDILSPLTGLTVAEVKALPVDERFDGMQVLLTDGRRFVFDADSVLTTDGDQLLIIPTSGTGVFVAAAGQVVDLEAAFTFATADAAVLYTVPTGANLLVHRGYWEVITTGFTGGAASTIGLSSSRAPHTTKGDLLGGGAGDAAATLVPGDYIPGTVGADQAAGIILKAGDTVRLDRITSAFTAGVGKAHLVATVLSTPG